MKFQEGELFWGLITAFLCPPKFTFSLKITGGREKSSKLFGVFENVRTDYTSLISVEIYVDYNIVSAHLGQYHIVITIYFDLYAAGHCEALVYFRFFGGLQKLLDTSTPFQKSLLRKLIIN